MAIYVVTHKAVEIPTTDWLLPIGVGGYCDDQVRLNDATGENIADKNRTYCELTATYWLWKHCNDPYIGLCHYRRLFAFLPVSLHGLESQPIVKAPNVPQITSYLSSTAQHQRLMTLLDSYDIIVPQPVLQYPSLAESFLQAHGSAIWSPFVAACRDEFGDIVKALNVESRFHYGNMLVARAEVFRDYCTRLFRVLDRVVEEVGIPDEVPGARYQPYRYPGYLGERFTNLYLLATRARYAVAQSIWLE